MVLLFAHFCVVIGLLTNRKKFTAKNLLNLCDQSAKSIMAVSIACMIAGVIIMGVLTAIVCIMLGMGLPTSACYIVLAVLVAPAMIELGVATISAHMFVLYYGVVAAITPPVALAVFAAIGISGGNMWKTGLQAMKMAASGFVIPFIFLYNTDLLMYNAVENTFGFSGSVAISFVTAAIGCMVMAIALFGWFLRDLKMFERIILLVCAICLMLNEPFILNVAGLIIAAIILVCAKITVKKGVPV